MKLEKLVAKDAKQGECAVRMPMVADVKMGEFEMIMLNVRVKNDKAWLEERSQKRVSDRMIGKVFEDLVEVVMVEQNGDKLEVLFEEYQLKYGKAVEDQKNVKWPKKDDEMIWEVSMDRVIHRAEVNNMEFTLKNVREVRQEEMVHMKDKMPKMKGKMFKVVEKNEMYVKIEKVWIDTKWVDLDKFDGVGELKMHLIPEYNEKVYVKLLEETNVVKDKYGGLIYWSGA